MKTQLRILSKKGFELVNFVDVHSLDPESKYWLEVKADSRAEVSDLLDKIELDSRLVPYIEVPSKLNRAAIFEGSALINLPISAMDKEGDTPYLSLILQANIIISILSPEVELFEEFIEEVKYNPLEFDLTHFHVLYYMIGEILQKGMDGLISCRNEVNRLSRLVDDEPDNIDITEIVLLKRMVGNMTNVVEDQFNILGFVPKLGWTEEYHMVRADLMEQVQGFSHLKNSVIRMESKVDGIQSHYELTLQEKATKRLNTLTVVQAIFVPLTFITGIYGMNFILMPELQLENGYFYIMIIMLLIVIAQLWYFWRKGWFD